MISMRVLGLLLTMATAYTPSDSQQSHAVLQPPRHCVKVLSNQTQETDLNCNVLTGTVWTFEWVQHWAKEHVQYGLNVYIKCEPNSTVILRQPIKAFLLRKLDINSCGLRQMYDYDLTADTAALAFTVRTLTIQDSVYFITFNELQALYIKYSRDVISKYPCYLPPSVEKYVERNVSVKSEGYGTKQQLMELREASRNHKFKLPQCEYQELRYYEKSFSRKNKLNFVRRFLDKGKFPSLEVLNISSLQLDRIPSELFREHWPEKFPMMKVVDISANNIGQIPFEFPPSSQCNITVNMTRNNITVLTESALNKLETFYPGRILLQDNPLSCACKLKPLLHFVRYSVKQFVQHYGYLRNLTCQSPVIVRGRAVGDVSFREVCRDEGEEEATTVENIPSYVFFITPPIFLLLITVIMVFFRFRKELKLIAFTRFTFRRNRTNREDLATKEYDAFVSYSSQDELFVTRMCTRLEGPPYQFKLCLHYKHFVPGLCISQNIIESVERSSHTIMILSNNFIESEWCILEFRKAFHQSLIGHNKHLIVILLEDIENDCLQPDMTYFLQTHTYLRADEYLFWDKLVYTLSNKRIDRDKNAFSVDMACAGKDKKNSRPFNRGDEIKELDATIPLSST
ncbi:protein toll-like [Mizuhopecten yessoensis]|nr:protein toll-like [Mizuhopecten yessoensis]